MDFKIKEIIQEFVKASNRHGLLALSQMVAEDVVFTAQLLGHPSSLLNLSNGSRNFSVEMLLQKIVFTATLLTTTF